MDRCSFWDGGRFARAHISERRALRQTKADSRMLLSPVSATAIVADTADLIAQHGLDVADVREALLYDMFGGRAKSSVGSAPA